MPRWTVAGIKKYSEFGLTTAPGMDEELSSQHFSILETNVVKLNELVSRGELKTDMVAMACGKFRDDSAPLKFTDVDGSIAQCPLVPVIDVLGVRVSHDGNSQVALFHRLAMATPLFYANPFCGQIGG